VLYSGSKFTGLFSPNARGIALDHVFPILDISIRSGDIRDRTLKWSEIDPNFARLCPQLFGGRVPKIWDLEFGTWLAKQERKKTSAVKHKSTWNYRSGWPNQPYRIETNHQH